jgi:hypothetical protein
MVEERKVRVAVWSANDETRAVEVAGILSSSGIAVGDLDFSTARPQVILILLGRGGAMLASLCDKIAQEYPQAPAGVFHTPDSESAHPAVDHHVFELLGASTELAKVADHLRTVFARWRRFEELTASATTLQRLESTTDLVYFDFRPETGTFCPSQQLRQIIGHYDPSDLMAPSPLLDCIHTDDRALFAGTLFEAARSATPFCVQIRLTDTTGRQRYFRVRGRAFGAISAGSSSRVFAVCEDTTNHMQSLAEAESGNYRESALARRQRRQSVTRRTSTDRRSHRARRLWKGLFRSGRPDESAD